MARIVTVYASQRQPFEPRDMSYVRWMKISDALARLGHEVDIATNEGGLLGQWRAVQMGPRLRRVPLRSVRWERYDIVKTLFHMGFNTLERYGGTTHPMIISKLGSVVGPADHPAVYFTGTERARLFATQERIAAASRMVTVLTEASRKRWESSFGLGRTLLVPGAADARVPDSGADPYPAEFPRRCLFAGNFYSLTHQPEAHLLLVAKMNQLGQLLAKRDFRLFVMGPGRSAGLNPQHVTCIGPVPHEDSSRYLLHATVGIVLALGACPNENESTKIYHYLRVGLPVVCESGFPNQGLVAEAKLGYVAINGDMERMADLVIEAANHSWDREGARQYILANHTWGRRAMVYDDWFRSIGLGRP